MKIKNILNEAFPFFIAPIVFAGFLYASLTAVNIVGNVGTNYEDRKEKIVRKIDGPLSSTEFRFNKETCTSYIFKKTLNPFGDMKVYMSRNLDDQVDFFYGISTKLRSVEREKYDRQIDYNKKTFDKLNEEYQTELKKFDTNNLECQGAI